MKPSRHFALLSLAFSVPHLPAPSLVELGTVTAIQGELSAGATSSGLAVLDRTRLNTVQTEMRTIQQQIEAYRADYGGFPVCTRIAGRTGYAPNDQRYQNVWSFVNSSPGTPGNLLTPTAYLTSMPIDPYSRFAGRDLPFGYFVDRSTGWYLIYSPGPDNDYDIDPLRHFEGPGSAQLASVTLNTADPNDQDGDLILTNRPN